MSPELEILKNPLDVVAKMHYSLPRAKNAWAFDLLEHVQRHEARLANAVSRAQEPRYLQDLCDAFGELDVVANTLVANRHSRSSLIEEQLVALNRVVDALLANPAVPASVAWAFVETHPRAVLRNPGVRLEAGLAPAWLQESPVALLQPVFHLYPELLDTLVASVLNVAWWPEHLDGLELMSCPEETRAFLARYAPPRVRRYLAAS